MPPPDTSTFLFIAHCEWPNFFVTDAALVLRQGMNAANITAGTTPRFTPRV
jgi:hypothetical protein